MSHSNQLTVEAPRRAGAATVSKAWVISDRIKSTLPGVGAAAASALVLIFSWQLIVWIWSPSPAVLPGPTVVFNAFGDNWQLLVEHSVVTLREVLTAFAMSCLLGLPIAIVLAFVPVVARMFYPIIVVAQAVPKIAIAPIIVAWFGFGWQSNLVLAFLVAVFPIIINGVLGFANIDQNLVSMGRIMGGGRRRVFLKIRLPNALPSIFAGLKVGITLATIGAVVGEFMAGSAGLGYVIQTASGSLVMELAFAAILALSILGVALFYIVQGLERLALPWSE